MNGLSITALITKGNQASSVNYYWRFSVYTSDQFDKVDKVEFPNVGHIDRKFCQAYRRNKRNGSAKTRISSTL
jgi:hypothetical protein